MSTDKTTFLGIEIGGTKLQVVIGSANGHILRRWRATVVRDRGGNGICDQLRGALREISSEARPAAVGAGFGGPIDRCSGTIVKSHQIAGWEGFELSAFLREITGAPAYVDNDANVAALGEAALGAGRDADPVFYVTLGSGVGGGFITGQTIYHGSAPGEAEFGHLWLDRDGTNVESQCSGWAVDRHVREVVEADPDGLLARFVGAETGGEARHLTTALEQNDRGARVVLETLADALGFALSHVAHLLHPQVIILGGGLSLIGEPLRESVTTALRKYIMAAFAPGPAVKLAELREDAVPVGALILAGRRSAITDA